MFLSVLALFAVINITKSTRKDSFYVIEEVSGSPVDKNGICRSIHLMKYLEKAEKDYKKTQVRS